MRPWLIIALSLASTAIMAVEAPTLTRDGPAAQTYDLGATAPWMPILWDPCTLTLPSSTTQVVVMAYFASGNGLGVDSTDALALREGHGVTLSGSSFTVNGISGTWSRSGGGLGNLEAHIPRSVDAATVLLLCRQLYYANSGGERTLARRRITIMVRAQSNGSWGDSAPLYLDIDSAVTDQPPKLRFDAMSVPLGGSVTWTPLGWYDGRHQATDLRWSVSAPPASVTVSGLVGGVRSDLTASIATAQPLSWFSTTQAQIHGASIGASAACTVQVGDGLSTAPSLFKVEVTQPSGELRVIGDFPFQLGSTATIAVFQASRADATMAPIAGWTISTSGGRFTVSMPANAPLAGTAVFTAGTSTYRIPFDVRRLAVTAN